MERKAYDCDNCEKEIKGTRYRMPPIGLGTEEGGVREILFNIRDGHKDFCGPGCLLGYFQKQINGGE